MKIRGRVDVQIHVFLTSALVGVECQLQALVALPLGGGKAHGTHWIGGWVGPRACLDDTEKENLLTLLELKL
jgi:hypothetical protein